MSLTATPTNPLPPGAREAMLTTADGYSIRTASWAATSGQWRGTICLLQGRAEFIEKYFETIEDFRRQGFAVITMDWRGQGGSERLLSNPGKGHISHFDRYERDLVALIEQAMRPDCPPPYFALAHSTGGLVLLRFMARRHHPFERAAFTSPLLGLGKAYEPVWAAQLLTRIASEIGLSRLLIPTGSAKPAENAPFLGNPLTTDEQRYARNCDIIAQAPQLGIGSPTIGWVRASLLAIADIAAGGTLEGLKTPIIMFGAGNDMIVSNQAIETACRRLPIARYFPLPGARHEVLMERDLIREQVLAGIDAFFSPISTP